MALKTIFFDAGGTLVFADTSRTLAPLALLAITPSREQLHAAERAAKQEFDRARAQHRSVDAQYWETYYGQLLQDLGLAEQVELRAALVVETRKSQNWRAVMPETRSVLERLRQRFRLGVISNSDGTIRELMHTVGLGDCFDSFTDSAICGHEKPDARIFEAAMASLGAAPHESLYVGDIYSVDFDGARSVGMHALLMDAAGTYRDTGYPRIESLRELEEQLTHFA
ncbi:MAG: HAD family hydrolase [Terriglobales bacterium]